MSDPQLPPPPPGHAPMQPSSHAATPSLDIGTTMSYGWNRFREHAGSFILLMLVVTAISIVVSQVSLFIALPALPGTRSGALGTLSVVAVLALQVIVAFFLQAGVYRAGLGVTEGIEPDLGMLVDPEHIVRFAATVLLVGLGTIVGLALCVVPGIVWLLFTVYAPITVLDQGVGPLRAIRQSVDAVGDHFGKVAPIVVVAYLVYWAGVLLCGVGVLVTGPVALIAVIHSYRWIRQQPTAA